MACKILPVCCHPTKMMPCSAGGCPRPAVPCQGQGLGEAVSVSSAPRAVAKPARCCSPSDVHREQSWAPADPHRAPVIYFFNREQQQWVTSGIWKRCVPVQGSLPNLAGGGFAKIPAPSRACAPAQPSTDTRIFFPQDARQRAALARRLSALVPSWMRRGEDLHFSAKPRAASPAPISRRAQRSPACTSCLCKPCENEEKSGGCCDLL